MKAVPLLLASVLAFLSFPASAQPFDVEQIAEQIAVRFRATLPRPFGRHLVMVDVRAEGTVLVSVFEGPGQIFVDMGEERIASLFAGGFCRGSGAAAMIRAGLRLRVDTRAEDGRTTRGRLIDHCPGDIAQVS